VTERQRKLHNVELYNVYPLPDRNIVSKIINLRCTNYVATMGDSLFSPFRNSHGWPGPHQYGGFRITLRRITIRRTPLDE
jgi:hypothetical protein